MHLCIPYDVHTNSGINMNLSLPGNGNVVIVNFQLEPSLPVLGTGGGSFVQKAFRADVKKFLRQIGHRTDGFSGYAVFGIVAE